jgi:tRNA nucleotidyltransferase (CCA-adding enzyme)
MADYIYLLQTRLTAAQQSALISVRDVARAKGITVFLVGGAVRDLTSGSPVRDLDVVVQGNALKLKKELLNSKLILVGESDSTQSLYFTSPGGVRLEVGSTLTITYPKPGKMVSKPANILDDLRRRDFTANAMAISLNDGSYGLLMDPLNGVADIENRELRLVSPYGFIEDPARMIRAARFGARLGFQMEAKTQQRYETGKAEGYISALSNESKSYETEEIFHEEDPLRVLRRLESEGWAKVLNPVLTVAKANEVELNKLRDVVSQLEGVGIFADPSAAYFPLVTAKVSPKDVAEIKKSFTRQGFVEQIGKLEAETKDFAAKFTNKAVTSPSETWKLLMSSIPEHVLSLAYSSKSTPVQARFQAFFHESPQARQRIPYQLLQEMRITPELPIYNQLIEDLFFAIMDKKLETVEAAKAFLEPFSPPAPPPPVSMRRRAVKRETKPAKRSKKVAAVKEALVEEAEASAIDATPFAAMAAAPAPAAKAVATTKLAPPEKAAVPVKTPPAKPAPAKPVVAKKSAPVAAKKPAQLPGKTKASGQKPVAKKAAKPVPKASPVKAKFVAKKTVVKKATVKKAPVKKAPAKTMSAKTMPAKKKAAPKKAAPKKAVPAKKTAVKAKRR